MKKAPENISLARELLQEIVDEKMNEYNLKEILAIIEKHPDLNNPDILPEIFEAAFRNGHGFIIHKMGRLILEELRKYMEKLQRE